MMECETFFVYELDDSGERKQLNITQQELESTLYPEQVLVIVREDLRRIFIWKGPKSPVRKRFISSRVAQDLQQELRLDSRYHRCKIVSVDAGDEPVEFLDAFQLESMEVTERLEDLIYIRNIDREQMEKSTTPTITKNEPIENYSSPTSSRPSTDLVKSSLPPTGYKSKSLARYSNSPKTLSAAGLSIEKQEEIRNTILKSKIPENCKRVNLILGHTLFAAVSKIANVFGEDIEEIEWEPMKKVPKKMIELSNHILRVYFDEKEGIVEAIEVLEKKGKEITRSSKTPPKKSAPKKKPTATRTAPKKKPTTARATPKKKPAITAKSSSMKGRKSLPKIPNKDDE
ncbi:MAG: hypothetical protein ACXAAI_03945 [Promethearchaeota archaeon]|jgi:hypothetical protein